MDAEPVDINAIKGVNWWYLNGYTQEKNLVEMLCLILTPFKFFFIESVEFSQICVWKFDTYTFKFSIKVSNGGRSMCHSGEAKLREKKISNENENDKGRRGRWKKVEFVWMN